MERTLITSTSITGSSYEAQGLERFKKNKKSVHHTCVSPTLPFTYPLCLLCKCSRDLFVAGCLEEKTCMDISALGPHRAAYKNVLGVTKG